MSIKVTSKKILLHKYDYYIHNLSSNVLIIAVRITEVALDE